jgi:DNA modification methylase
MTSKRSSANQPPLFKPEVSEMPEGYYSSGSNPNLRRFVEEHATPYEPAIDDYHVPPFDKPIQTTKSTAIYNMHTYQGKKPHDAIRRYIRHYAKPGDLVMDPFCGSGGTALAALIEGCAAIAIDRSPAATFITKNYCKAINAGQLQRAFDELKARVKPELDWLYETRCDRCDGRATTTYTLYSSTFQCPRCLEAIPLFDCVAAKGRTAAGKPKKIKACPKCYARGHVEEISRRTATQMHTIPVMIGYECDEGCTPRATTRRHNDSNEKKRAFFAEYDLGKITEIENSQIPYWYPQTRMLNVPTGSREWGVLWRPYHGDIKRVDQFFTRRNLWALSCIYDAIQQFQTEVERDALHFALNAILMAMSKMQGYVDNPRFPNQLLRGTYYIPPVRREYNVLNWLEGKVDNLKSGYEKISGLLSSNALIISTQSATDLPQVESNSIDYIFTDPPYAGNVQYGELNFVWEAWAGFDTDWHDEEIIVNEIRGKTDADWARLMRRAMSECYRVLKPGRWISLCYHDTSEGTWHLVQDLMTEVGFIPEQLDAPLYIDTAQKSFNQLMADKVTRRDLVINFRKPRPGELIAQLTLLGDEDEATFAEKARAILREALEAHPGSPADRLYDELVSRMVRKGEFERHDFDQLLHSVAEESPPDSGRWYLLETAEQVDDAESAKEAAAAAHLEAFMHTYLEEHPAKLGVHYSDLFEQYLPVHDKPRRLLADWLPEYFFKTPEGTWRPPANDEERAQKEALRTSGVLRRIKCFARALSEGVPPHDRDRPTNAATAANWIRECRRAGLYEFGRVLYEKGGFKFEELGDEGLLEVEEDYQICVRRS